MSTTTAEHIRVDLDMDYGNVIVMLARQRSGTNALRSVLRTHPDIFCFPEVLELDPPTDYELALDSNYFRFLEQYFNGSMISALTVEDHAIVFPDFLEYLYAFTDKRFILLDIKYNSVHHIRRAWQSIAEEPLLFQLIRDHGMRVLHLRRSNYLRYYLSEVKAQQSRRWHLFDEQVVGDEAWYQARAKTSSSTDDCAIEIDVDDLLQTLERCARETDQARASLTGHEPQLELEYEALFGRMGDPLSKTAIDKVCAWLEVPAGGMEVRPEYKKQSVLPLAETVANYPAVVEALTGTKWEYYLEDEAIYNLRASGRRTSAIKSHAS